MNYPLLTLLSLAMLDFTCSSIHGCCQTELEVFTLVMVNPPVPQGTRVAQKHMMFHNINLLINFIIVLVKADTFLYICMQTLLWRYTWSKSSRHFILDNWEKKIYKKARFLSLFFHLYIAFLNYPITLSNKLLFHCFHHWGKGILAVLFLSQAWFFASSLSSLLFKAGVG